MNNHTFILHILFQKHVIFFYTEQYLLFYFILFIYLFRIVAFIYLTRWAEKQMHMFFFGCFRIT